MRKVIKLKESQFVGLMDLLKEDIKIIGNADDLPNIVSELQKIVGEGKEKVRTILNFLLDKTQRDIIENRDTYVNYLEKLKSLEREYSNKHSKYFDMVDRFFEDYSEDNLSKEVSQYYRQADKLVGELDNVQMDISKVVDYFDEMVYHISPEDIEYFFKQYPEKNIEI